MLMIPQIKGKESELKRSRKGQAHTNTRKLNRDISTGKAVFLSLSWSLQFLVRVFTFLCLNLWFSYFGTFLSTWYVNDTFILIPEIRSDDLSRLIKPTFYKMTWRSFLMVTEWSSKSLFCVSGGAAYVVEIIWYWQIKANTLVLQLGDWSWGD